MDINKLRHIELKFRKSTYRQIFFNVRNPRSKKYLKSRLKSTLIFEDNQNISKTNLDLKGKREGIRRIEESGFGTET